ncbi:MFS transporter [Rhodobacter capsulatus]|uniref:hypothetical protein n=1 Tax=Rhodobacter capsulatus TaxID=1061 RepID=UPI0006DC4FDD|nr:hypothetical protein [Rhodobacter capsulatus]KQB12873.1 hypothetical protein AP071_05585 [Rhodobacter capsulatus]
MALRQVARVSRATGIGLCALGVFWGAFAAQMPAFKDRAGVGDGLFGVLLLGSALGGMAAMALAPQVGRWLGPRVLPLTGAFLALAALMPLFIHSGLTLALALVVMGVAMSSLDLAANVRISELEHDTALPLMNWNHALFSAGFAVSALLAGMARRAGLSPEAVQPVLALVLVAMAAAMIEARRAPPPVPRRPRPRLPPARPGRRRWRRRRSCSRPSLPRTRPRPGRRCISSAIWAAPRARAPLARRCWA